MKRPPRKGEGRPTKYTKALGDLICSRISLGEAVRNICADETMPVSSTIYLWLLDEDKREFSDNYARARASQAEMMFEEIIEIADASDRIINEGAEKKSSAYAQNQRLRVDTRKWYLSKVLPKKYGDKVDLTSAGEAIKGNTILLSNFEKKSQIDETNG